jgi:hypothetical protein
MVELRDDPNTVYGERKYNTGSIILGVIVAAAVIVGLLFATGFWSADVKEGSLPEVSVKGGDLPAVDVDSKKVVVGTKETTVDVPVVGVKDK